MEKYNYKKAILEDVLEYIREHYTKEEIKVALEDKDDFFEKLNDDLWINDGVTGNASGSYTFNTWQAEENLCHNLDLLEEALDEFGGNFEKALMMGAEHCDVTIRCYLLGWAIDEALEQLEEELEII